VPLAALARENCTGRFVRPLTVPSHLDLSGHANESDLAGFAERETVANAKLSSMKSGPCSKVRKAVAPGVECSRLGLVWIDAKFVAEYHKAGLRSGAIGAGSRTRQEGRRFPCRLKPDSPRAAETYGAPCRSHR
jgi:hypothetical protein